MNLPVLHLATVLPEPWLFRFGDRMRRGFWYVGATSSGVLWIDSLAPPTGTSPDIRASCLRSGAVTTSKAR